MSTYWYYECADHDPPIRSREEFTQHTDDEHYKSGIDLLEVRPVVRDDSYWTFSGSDAERAERYFTMQACSFLVDHPKCHIRIVNEYGIYAEGVPADGVHV